MNIYHIMTESLVWVKISNYFQDIICRKLDCCKWLARFLVRTEGSSRLLFTGEHCFAKKSLESSAFSSKSMINLSLCNSGGIKGIFHHLERSLILNRMILDVFYCLKLYCLFLWMGFNYFKAREQLQVASLLFTIKSPEIPGIYLINLGRMTGWVDLGATHWFLAVYQIGVNKSFAWIPQL